MSLGTMIDSLYDAEGRRVAKGTITAWPAAGSTCAAPTAANGFTLTNQYLRGVSGDQDTELDGSGNWIHTNIFAGSGVQATYWNSGTAAAPVYELSYIYNDWLGTKREQFSNTGSKQSWWDSDPFGDYMTAHGNGDANELHLTGKEHDAESGNDYFGARYYNSPMGRFMSPDWSAKAEPVPYAKMGNPQTLNLYAFVGNNPISHVDVDGHQAPGPDRGNTNCASNDTNSDSGCQGNTTADQMKQEQDQQQQNQQQANSTAEDQQQSGPTVGQQIGHALDQASDFTNTYLALPAAGLQLMEGMDGTPAEANAADELEAGAGAFETRVAAAEQEATTVYQKVDEAYIGMTKNIENRSADYGQKLEGIVTLPTRIQARAVEQAAILQRGLGNLTNKINSIATSNPIYQKAVEYGTQVLKSIGFE